MSVLSAAVDVAFEDVEAALAERRGHASPALIATVVVVASRERVAEAAEALAELGAEAAVRAILIVEGQDGSPRVRVAAESVLIDGLRAAYLNNAVAALRLSSLPSLVWWRGGSPGVLRGLAALADRLVLDAEDPAAVWPRVPELAEEAAVTDIRWSRLTRWRALTAQFFDMESVRESEAGFRALEIVAGDVHSADLFAGWLTSSLPHGRDLRTAVTLAPGGAPIESVRLAADRAELTLRIAPSRQCVESTVWLPAMDQATSRVVSLGHQRLSALLAEELRIRSRDAAFERAVAAIRTTR